MLMRRFRVHIGDQTTMSGEFVNNKLSGASPAQEVYDLYTLHAADRAEIRYINREVVVEINNRILYRGPCPAPSTTEYVPVRFTSDGVLWAIESLCIWPGAQ